MVASGGQPVAPAGLDAAVAARYRRGFDLAVVWLVGLWFAVGNLVTSLPEASAYRSFPLEAGAWLVMGGIGVLLLLHRPVREQIAFTAANSSLTLVALLLAGAGDRLTLARFGAVAYATGALQVALVLAAGALDATARRAAAAATAEAAVRRDRQVAGELHAARQGRYRALRASAVPLLAGLASGALDPADRLVRHRCAVEAGRLRRLFAETDDVPDPLVHELRACADVADRRGVLVDLQVLGRLPVLDRPVRRALTEAPLDALAGAARQARITVVGRCDEVAVSVLVDGTARRVTDPGGPVGGRGTDQAGAAAPGEQGEPAGPGGAAEPGGDPAGGTGSERVDRTVTVTVQEGDDQRWVEARWRRG